jgi:site-specific recombinase XerD
MSPSSTMGRPPRAVPALGDQSTVRDVVDAFISQPGFSPGTRRKYGETLRRLTAMCGSDPISELESVSLVTAVMSFGSVGPATWNRHLAAMRSFTAFCRKHRLTRADLPVTIERRREPASAGRSVSLPALEREWGRPDVALREKTLWRLLYETAARASEVLGLNVEDLDLQNHRALVFSKGQEFEWLFFQAGAARLLPRLIGGSDVHRQLGVRRQTMFARSQGSHGSPIKGPRSSSKHIPVGRSTSFATQLSRILLRGTARFRY